MILDPVRKKPFAFFLSNYLFIWILSLYKDLVLKKIILKMRFKSSQKIPQNVFKIDS